MVHHHAPGGRAIKALILVDIQNDFLLGGALAVPDGDAVIAVANRLAEAFDVVVCTQDWHPADHQSFAVHHPGATPGSVIDLHGLSQVLWPVHCVQGSHGAEFAAALDTSGVTNIFLMPLDGDEPQQVTDFSEGEIFYFDVSPDGSTLLMAQGRRIRDIVLIDNFR